MLSDREIKQGVLRYDLIEGYQDKHLNPASYDLTLSDVIRVPFWGEKAETIDTRDVQPYTVEMPKPEEGYDIYIDPGKFLLAATNEVLNVPPHLSARVEGKSSLGRIGLAVHITAGFIDPGFVGSVTLEIANLMNVPIILYPGMRIAQVAFTLMSDMPEVTYGVKGNYQNQPKGIPVESRYKIESS